MFGVSKFVNLGIGQLIVDYYSEYFRTTHSGMSAFIILSS